MTAPPEVVKQCRRRTRQCQLWIFFFFFRYDNSNNTKKDFSVFLSINAKKNRPSCFLIKFLCLFVLKMFVVEIDQGDGDA